MGSTAQNEKADLDTILDALVKKTRREYGAKIRAARRAAGKRENMSADKPAKVEPAPFHGTIHELVEKLCESIESWSDYEKAELRAALTGKLSADVSERIQ